MGHCAHFVADMESALVSGKTSNHGPQRRRHLSGTGPLREDGNAPFWLLGNSPAQALEPSAQGPQAWCSAAAESQLPPVCVVESAFGLSPSPHDTGHLLQQRAAVPVQLRTDRRGHE